MKKSRMMRLASFMLVLTLLTTCMISGTFAKYVTAGTGTDSARVAKFGVAVTANGNTFSQTYAKDDNSFTLEANTVVSTDDKVVAPGTNGEMVNMALTGTPEVAVRVSYEGNFDIADDRWVVDGDYYCPLVVNVNGAAFDGATYANAAAFEKAVNDAIAAYSKDYAAGTDLSGVGADALDITWKWPFSTSADNDVKDTKLGNEAAAGSAATVELKVKTTVTQID